MADKAIHDLPTLPSLTNNTLIELDLFAGGGYTSYKCTLLSLGNFLGATYYSKVLNSSGTPMPQRSQLEFNGGFALTDDSSDGITNVNIDTTYFNQRWIPLSGTSAGDPITGALKFGSNELTTITGGNSGINFTTTNNTDTSVLDFNVGYIDLYSYANATPSIYGEIYTAPTGAVVNFSSGSIFAAPNNEATIGYAGSSKQTQLSFGASGKGEYRSTVTTTPGLTYEATTAGYVSSNHNQYSLLHRAAGDARWAPIVSGGYLPLSGGTMTGFLTLNADPGTNLQAATKQYVDNHLFLTSLQDTSISSPSVDQILKYNGAAWVNGNATTVNSGAGVDFYHDDTVSDITGYQTLNRAPENIAEQTVTGVANNGRTLIKAYASASAGLGGTQIDGGEWIFDVFASVDVIGAGFSSVDIDVYKRTSGGTETLLFNVNSGTITSSVALYSLSSIQQPFSINSTDRLVVKIYAKTTALINRTVTFYYGGTTHYSNFSTPLVSRHNDLAGLQGGASGQYYHLTSAEYTGTGTGNFVRLASPTFTGSPAAPTQAQYDNSTKLATTAYVDLIHNGKFLIGNSSNVGTEVNMSGDATMDNAGALTVANNAITYGKSYNGNQLTIVNTLRIMSGN